MAERLGRELIRAVAGCDAADQTATLNSAGCQRDSLLATSPAGLAKARFSLSLLPVGLGRRAGVALDFVKQDFVELSRFGCSF